MRALACTLLVLLLLPTRAFAWVEWHHLGDSVRLTLAADGHALVETTARYDVARGPIKTFDVQGIDADAKVDADLDVQRLAPAPLGTALPPAPDGESFSVRGHVEPLPRRPDAVFEGQAVRLVMDVEGAKNKGGLPRGAYAVTYRYKVDAARWISREGSHLRLVFQGASAPEGYDSARLFVVVPTAAEPPKLAPLPWGATASALRRGPGEDELELVRPHVARAEAPKFAVDLDPRLLALAPRTELRPPPPVAPAPKTREHVVWAVFAACFAGLAYWLVRGASRAAAAATLMVASVAVEALVGLEWTLAIAPFVLGLGLVRPRETGTTWERVRPPVQPAFPWQPVAGLAALAGLVALSWLVSGTSLAAGSLVRSVALIPALVALCPERTPSLLGQLARHAAKDCKLQTSFTARADELRLALVPAHPLDGFVGLELGKTRAGFASLVRVRAGSAAEARLVALWPKAASRPGREGERAYVAFAPTTRSATLRRIVALVGPAFGERRHEAAPVLTERRKARAARTWTPAPA